MEHFIRQSPDHYTLSQALRYGEARGLGAGEELAQEIACGKLGQDVRHSAFWRTVLNFFAINPQRSIDHVNPIIDFIWANKFGSESTAREHEDASISPPWPDFSIKGRTVKSILRMVSEWHGDLSKMKPTERISWMKSGIRGFCFVEKRTPEETDCDWTIHELLTGAELHAEGVAMRHCVYSYVHCCKARSTTIWSLRLRIKGRQKRIATIEVLPRQCSIVQVRAKFNRRPSGRALDVIQQWAAAAGLGFNLRL
jgi:hypothetical protein